MSFQYLNYFLLCFCIFLKQKLLEGRKLSIFFTTISAVYNMVSGIY